MRPPYFRYQTDERGRVVVAGLTPDETLEFEALANQVDNLRQSADERRLQELCHKHRSFISQASLPGIADVFAAYPGALPDPAPAASPSGRSSQPTDQPPGDQLEFAFDSLRSDSISDMTHSHSSG